MMHRVVNKSHFETRTNGRVEAPSRSASSARVHPTHAQFSLGAMHHIRVPARFCNWRKRESERERATRLEREFKRQRLERNLRQVSSVYAADFATCAISTADEAFQLEFGENELFIAAAVERKRTQIAKLLPSFPLPNMRPCVSIVNN